MKNIVRCFEKLDGGKDMRFSHKSLFKKNCYCFCQFLQGKKTGCVKVKMLDI